MITKFIENYARLIVSAPEDVTVTKELIDENFAEIIISVNSVDIGKLIGKNGNMINALKTMANGCKAKDGVSYKIQVIVKQLPMNNNIFVAKLGKAVGLQGHLRLIIDSDFPEQFKKGAVFGTNRNLQLKVLEYNSIRELVKFENYEDVELAKNLLIKNFIQHLNKQKNFVNQEKMNFSGLI